MYFVRGWDSLLKLSIFFKGVSVSTWIFSQEADLCDDKWLNLQPKHSLSNRFLLNENDLQTWNYFSRTCSEREKWMKSVNVWRNMGKEWKEDEGMECLLVARKKRLKRFYVPSFSSHTLTAPHHHHHLLSLVISQGHVLCILRNYLAKVLLLKASLPGPAGGGGLVSSHESTRCDQSAWLKGPLVDPSAKKTVSYWAVEHRITHWRQQGKKRLREKLKNRAGCISTLEYWNATATIKQHPRCFLLRFAIVSCGRMSAMVVYTKVPLHPAAVTVRFKPMDLHCHTSRALTVPSSHRCPSTEARLLYWWQLAIDQVS